MKPILVLTAAALLTASVPAKAQRVDVSTIKCKEFLTSSSENIAFIMMWMQGYYSADDASPIIDFDKMKNGRHQDRGILRQASRTTA